MYSSVDLQIVANSINTYRFHIAMHSIHVQCIILPKEAAKNVN